MDELFGRVKERDSKRADKDYVEGGIFKVLFLKKDEVIKELLSLLEAKLKCEGFQESFIRRFRNMVDGKRESLLSEARRCEESGRDSRFYTFRLPALERQLAITSLDDYLIFLRDPLQGHPGIIELLEADFAYFNGGDRSGVEFITEQYHLYEIGSFLYDCYVKKVSLFKRFEQLGSSALREIYQERGIDLMVSDPQFSKYRLLSFGEGLRIVNDKDSQTIFDGKVGLHYWIDVPRDLLAAIEAAMANAWVKEIAFNVDCITSVTPGLEDMEYGSPFSFDALQLPDFSKLYDGECYEDSLWIRVEKHKVRPSITFEELYADFPELDGKVVTRVVHLELKKDIECWNISHIDHEYILYTLDEYAERQVNPAQKGHAKIKTFKIDNASIPFDFRFRDRYFLFQVLDSYFANKTLVYEYFLAAQMR